MNIEYGISKVSPNVWTTKHPNCPGFWWVRMGEQKAVCLVWLAHSGSIRVKLDSFGYLGPRVPGVVGVHQFEEFGISHFAGPLLEPELEVADLDNACCPKAGS